MELKSICISLDLAKKLKEIGIVNNSLFYWRRHIPLKGSSYIRDEWKISLYKGSGNYEIIPAYTASDLLELLPLLKGSPVELIKGADFINGLYYCCRYFYEIENIHAESKNAADACAMMLIFLKEQGLLKDDSNTELENK